MGDWLSKNWIDLGSFVVAVCFLAYQVWKKRVRLQKGNEVFLTLANGFAIFPLLVMLAAYFKPDLACDVAQHDNAIMALSAVAAIYAVAKEAIDPGAPEGGQQAA